MSRIVRRRLVVCAIAAILPWSIFSVWSIEGTVIDEVSGKGISDATVLISLYAREVEPPYPHAWTASSRCLRSVVLKTDDGGKFKTLRVTAKPWLIRSGAAINVLKEGWYLDGTQHVEGRRNLFGMFVNHNLSMRRDQEERWSFPPRQGEDPRDYELTLSRQFSGIVQIGSSSNACSEAAYPVVQQALLYGITHAETEAEVRYVRLRCTDTFNRIFRLGRGWDWSVTVDKDISAKFPECRRLFQDI